MKITKQQLKELIKEELGHLSENEFLNQPDPDEWGSIGHDADVHSVEGGFEQPLRQIQEDITEILEILRSGGGSFGP
jgi:hypothetical protein